MDVSNTFAGPGDYRTRAAPGAPERPMTVACGTRVTVRRGILISDLWIVEQEEAGGGRVAAGSPLGRVLIGAQVGEAVEYQAGGRVEEIRIMAIAPA